VEATSFGAKMYIISDNHLGRNYLIGAFQNLATDATCVPEISPSFSSFIRFFLTWAQTVLNIQVVIPSSNAILYLPLLNVLKS
jgi:hypothetical protein